MEELMLGKEMCKKKKKKKRKKDVKSFALEECMWSF